MIRRVVVTGMGCINALGHSVAEFWENAKKGHIGIAPISAFDTEQFKVKVAAEVKGLDACHYLPRRLVRRSERFVHLALIAATEAMGDSKLRMDEEDPYRVGVCVGSAIGGLERMVQETIVARDKGFSKVNPLTVPLVIGNMASANIAMLFQMQGKCMGVVSACATGTDSIGEAYQSIRSGQCDAMAAGGSDSMICAQGIASFQQLQALTAAADPARASIPFDKDRNGFVMGEGAGVLVLEELGHAKKRGAHIYGEIIGYGCTNDAYHMTAAREDGSAAAKAMELALEGAGVSPGQVSYINAHGTGTRYNDLYETRAIKKVFGPDAYKIPVNSTKSLIGHSLAGSGAMEAIVCLLSMRDSYVHVTAGLLKADRECDLDYVQGAGRKQEVEIAVSNSFGFGGHNSTLVFAREDWRHCERDKEQA